jgi:hypothetical protein
MYESNAQQIRATTRVSCRIKYRKKGEGGNNGPSGRRD